MGARGFALVSALLRLHMLRARALDELLLKRRHPPPRLHRFWSRPCCGCATIRARRARLIRVPARARRRPVDHGTHMGTRDESADVTSSVEDGREARPGRAHAPQMLAVALRLAPPPPHSVQPHGVHAARRRAARSGGRTCAAVVASAAHRRETGATPLSPALVRPIVPAGQTQSRARTRVISR